MAVLPFEARGKAKDDDERGAKLFSLRLAGLVSLGLTVIGGIALILGLLLVESHAR